jgi:hypothetical protein
MATMQIKRMPKDLYIYLLKMQSEIKKKKGVKQFSLELTAIAIIREHKDNNLSIT